MKTFLAYNSFFEKETIIDCYDEVCTVIYKTPYEPIYKIEFQANKVLLSVLTANGYDLLHTWNVKTYDDFCWKIQKTQIKTCHNSGNELYYKEVLYYLENDFGQCMVTQWFNYLIYGNKILVSA